MSDDYIPTRLPEPGGYMPTRPDESPMAANARSHAMLHRRLFDRYEVFRYREGGFGVVYMVQDTQTGREYAVKTYRPELAGELPSVEEFKAEVEFWITLDPHPNIVTAHFVEVDSGQPYLFMDYIGGSGPSSVRDWLQAGAFGEEQAIDLAYQLCLGMEYANARGETAHLDLKPENLLLERGATGAGTLKVTDFGLARRIRTVQGRYPRVTRGSLPYEAPEQILEGQVDSRSDIYAFGIILHEMLTGRRPYLAQLSPDPAEQARQVRAFHEEGGTKETVKQLYWEGLPGFRYGKELGMIISACLGYQSERWRDFSNLREVFEDTFGLRPPSYTAPASAPDVGRSRAQALQRIGRHSEALAVFNRLLQHQPGEPGLWVEAAQCLFATGQVAGARELLRTALRLDPGCEEARRLLAETIDCS